MPLDNTDRVEWFWRLLTAVGLIIAVVLGIFWIRAPKNVDYYYLSHSGASNTATCVYAHWTWHPDEMAFCTDNIVLAEEYANKANQELKVK